jgi:hypothetical protein
MRQQSRVPTALGQRHARVRRVHGTAASFRPLFLLSRLDAKHPPKRGSRATPNADRWEVTALHGFVGWILRKPKNPSKFLDGAGRLVENFINVFSRTSPLLKEKMASFPCRVHGDTI